MKFLSLPLLLLFLSIFAASADALSPGASNRLKPYDWGIVYYMSYDNNLEFFGKSIINEIRKGVKSPRTVVSVQADFSDERALYEREGNQ